MKNFLKVAFLGALVFSQIQGASADDAIPSTVVEGGLKGYSEAEVKLVKDDLKNIKALSFRHKTGSKTPTYLSTAGGPGSMKSTILETFMKEAPQGGDNFVYADPDVRGLKFMINTYLQDMGPYAISKNSKDYAKAAYEKWRGASNYIAPAILNKAYAKGFSIAHGTTATSAAVTNLYKNLKKKGYKIVLLLCDTTDENRQASIRNREETQGFYQVTPEDAVTKSVVFYDRFADYFEYADQLYFYWTDDYQEGSIQAAKFNKESGLEILNQEAFEKFKGRYDEARANKPELKPFDEFVKG